MTLGDTLHIAALGSLRITLAGQPVDDLTSQKAGALLVYLAYTGQAHARERLAELLWAERSQARALGSLRTCLAALRRSFPAHLQASRQAVALVPDSYHLDARVLVDAFDAFAGAGDRAAPHLARRLADALDLYRGDLLRDFYGGSPEFEEWAERSREALREAYFTGVTRLADYHTRSGDDDDALRVIRRALQIDPLNEPVIRQLMRSLSRSGRRGEALEAYLDYAGRLQTHLDIEPAAETTALYRLILDEQPIDRPLQPPGAAAEAEAGAPLYPTVLIGREKLLIDIAARLADPDCKLLTLVGPGGIGKTRLALAAADMSRQGGVSPDGVFVVPLVAYTSLDQVVGAVAAALRYRMLPDGRSARRQVVDYLRGRAALLVLDNYEHLLDCADFAAEVGALPGVRVMVTSREPLNIPDEHLLTVGGLAYPAQSILSGTLPDSAHARSDARSDAADLFIHAARRWLPHYAPSAADADAIIRICQLVDGSPLGLLLAAAWISLLTPDAIAAQIQEGIAALEDDAPEIPARQRSIRAVFDATWERLPAKHQAIMMRLSVFRGGCLPEAAQTVAGADLRDLQALVKRALIARDTEGRLTLHELLRQYAEERLRATEDDAQARGAHSAYYLDFLIGREANVKGIGGRQAEALAEIDADFQNIRLAWEWAARQRRFEGIDRALECLYWYGQMRQRLPDRDSLLALALEQVEAARAEAASSIPFARVYGRLLARCWGTLEEAHPRLRRALRLAMWSEDAADIAHCLYQRGHIAMKEGRDAIGAAFLKRAHEAYVSIGDAFYPGVISSDWGVALIYCGRADQAEGIVERALPAMRTGGNRIYLSNMLYNMASCLATRGADDEADIFHRAAREVYLELGSYLAAADVAGWGMGISALRAGDFTLARQRAQDLLALARDVHSSVQEARALCTLSAVGLVSGDVRYSYDLAQEATTLLGAHANATYADAYLAAAAAALGDFRFAGELCRRWLGLAVEVREHVLTSLLLIPAAAVLANDHEREEAIACASLALHHPASLGRWAAAVLSLYGLPDGSPGSIALDGYAPAWERGRTLDPQVIVARFPKPGAVTVTS